MFTFMTKAILIIAGLLSFGGIGIATLIVLCLLSGMFSI